MQIEKITKPEQLVVSTSTHIAHEFLPTFIGTSFVELLEYIQKNGAELIGTPFISYLNLDESGLPKDELLEIEIGFPINKELPSTEKFQSYLLPSYQAVRTLYIGDYDDLTDSYKELIEAIKQENGIFTYRSYEYYLTDASVPLADQETMIELAFRKKRKDLFND
ncbi:MAG: GyrI-like domain-containing protein [Enterococcus sp.]|uniref:GyrI-like domain-containing protein n=1 Tax=Enterococcus TaxID=1350 RepID=UPI002FC64727